MTEGTGKSVEGVHTERGKLVLVLNNRIKGLIHEENVLLRRQLDAMVIKTLDAGGNAMPRFARKEGMDLFPLIILPALL